jgi:hypothetical protein
MIKSYSSSLHARTFLEKVLDELGADEPEQGLRLIRRMKQLLLRYREEREQLRQLGLEDVGDVREILLALKRRVEALEDEVEAHREAGRKLHAIQDALDVDASPEETVTAIQSINEQLESLYEEREELSELGISDANEAAQLIETMREQLDLAYERMDTDPEAQDADAFDRLERELGVSDPDSIIKMVQSMENQIEAEVDAESSDASSLLDLTSAPTVVQLLDRQMRAAYGGDVDPPSDEFPPFAPSSLLDRLATRTPEALSASDLGAVGAVALDDDNHVRRMRRAEPSIPGVETASVGDAFFDRVPTAQNPLIRDQIRNGRRAGTLDARLWYAFPRSGSAAPLLTRLHLYRTAGSEWTWLLYDGSQ